MASQNEGIGLLDEAKELFKALEDAMNALVTLAILVEAYQRQNRHEEVRELLKEQLQIKRSLSESIDAEAINKVADSYLKQKQYREARAAFTFASAPEPETGPWRSRRTKAKHRRWGAWGNASSDASRR